MWEVCVRTGLATVLAVSALPVAADPGREPARGVRVVVSTPQSGALVRNRTDMAPLAGFAEAGERPTHFDVMLVIDVSGSTAYPSGVDVDGDGKVGEQSTSLLKGLLPTKNTDPEDSILAAEIAAGQALLQGLDPARVQVGVVSFSGEADPATGRRRSPSQVDAILEAPLSSDFARVSEALNAVLLRGPNGGTNMEAGVKLALRELAGLSGARSRPRGGAKKVILFLTDGKPSLPFGMVSKEDPEDIEAAVDAARLAKTAGITLNVFGLGPRAIDYPIAATKMASVTGGLYTPVRRPGDIVSLLTGISFANVEDVVAVNLTLGEMAGPDDVLLQPDGSFRAFVPVRPGRNRIRVSALASDGSRGSVEFEIDFKHQDLTDAELQAELERVRRRNRELQLVMERKRQQEFRKQEQQRALTIEVEGSERKPRNEESQP